MKNLYIILFVFLVNNICFALKPDTIYHWKPNKYGLMFKEYVMNTSDNYKIKAWFYPAQEALSTDSMMYYFNKKTELRTFTINNNKKPTIIICDGDAGNMCWSLTYAKNYCTNGFNVVTFDWRGFGESQRFPIDTNFLVNFEFILDYNAVIDFVKQIETVDSNKIGVFGFSTGAFLSYAIAMSRNDVKALAARGLFTDYQNISKRLINIIPNDTYLFPTEIDNYSPRNTWDKFSKPIFLIVGEMDNRTPKEDAIEIISNVKSNIRELWIVKNAQHGGKLAPEFVENDFFFKKTIRFFNENL